MTPTDEQLPSKRAAGIKRCAEWLSYCLSIGYKKTDLDALEKLFWQYRDQYGMLKKKL